MSKVNQMFEYIEKMNENQIIIKMATGFDASKTQFLKNHLYSQIIEKCLQMGFKDLSIFSYEDYNDSCIKFQNLNREYPELVSIEGDLWLVLQRGD